MRRMLLTLFTLVCFTGCATLQPLNQTLPAPTEKSAPQAATGSGSTLWVVIGVLAAIGVVVLLTRDDGGGGS